MLGQILTFDRASMSDAEGSLGVNELALLVMLVVVASLLSISVEWHVAAACLWLVHMLVSVWLAVVATPELAVSKAVTGTTVCLLLIPSLRAFSQARAAVGTTGMRRLVVGAGTQATDEPFMLVGAFLAAAAAIALSFAFPLVEGASNFAWYWLTLLGLLLIMLSRDIVRIGLGLLLLLNAVDLLDTMVTRNQGVTAIGARSMVAIVLALALSVIWGRTTSVRSRSEKADLPSLTVTDPMPPQRLPPFGNPGGDRYQGGSR